MEKEQKKNLLKLGLPIIMGTILLLGVSYAWFTLTLNGTKTNILKAGTLSLTLTDTATNGINIEGAVPMLDEVGVTTSPYSFTLKNNGILESEYTIYLDDIALSTGETKLPDTVIKYNLVKDSTSVAIALLSTTGSNSNRVLDSGVIAPNTTHTYDLRLWLDQDATIEQATGKVFKGKIRVVAEQIKEKAPTDEACFTFSSGEITDYSDTCPKDVVIPKTINGTAVTSIGASAFQDNQLTSVVIPSSVTSIESYAFMNNQLTSVVIPSSVTSIQYCTFNDNQLPDSQAFIFKRNSDGTEDKTTVMSYGGANKDVVIPEGVTTIDVFSFSYNQLTSVVIPERVTKIGHEAFISNQLTSVIIKGKSSSGDFVIYNPVWGWASGYDDNNITWNG